MLALTPARILRYHVIFIPHVHQKVLMRDRDEARVVLTPCTPDHLRDKVILSKDLIAHQLEMRLLIVINGNEDKAVTGQQMTHDTQACIHHGAPLGVEAGIAITVNHKALALLIADTCLTLIVSLALRKGVFVHKIGTSVVRWIKVDHLDRSAIAAL